MNQFESHLIWTLLPVIKMASAVYTSAKIIESINIVMWPRRSGANHYHVFYHLLKILQVTLLADILIVQVYFIMRDFSFIFLWIKVCETASEAAS